MMKQFFAWLVVCLCLLACQGQRIERDDLIHALSAAEKESDTQVILFGTPEGKMLVGAGWWPDAEWDHGAPYRWIVSTKAEFVFSLTQSAPRYLHLQMRSFFSNPTEIFVNQKSVSKIEVDTNKQDFAIPLDAASLVAGINQVEMRFAEIRAPQEGTNDRRQLAAAVYYAVITPSKYFEVPSGEQVQEEFWKTGRIQIGAKDYASIACDTGGTIRYFKPLGANSSLQFGYYFKPRDFAESDDFAEFTVSVRDRKTPDRIVFTKRVSDQSSGFMRLNLGPYVKSPDDVHEIVFSIQRNSIFDRGISAWIQPLLIQNASDHARQDRQITLRQIRNQHQGANVMVVVLDAGAAKHYSTYGYFRKTTPAIDQLAREGIQFDSAYTQAVYTLASTASLMTGLYPFHHRVLYLSSKLPSNSNTMARIFKEGGYDTGTFVANGNASSTFGLTQGFDEVAEVFRDKYYTGWGQDITNRFTAWLEKKRNKPFFAYLHYREPHAPFRPPREWVGKFVDPNYNGWIGPLAYTARKYDIREKINVGEVKAAREDLDYITALYDANLSYGDSQIGQVVQELKNLKIYDNTILIVTSDHGEAFWEHGYSGHNVQLYQESIHIPLVIKPARGSGSSLPTYPHKVEATVRTIDLFPTLVDLIGLSRRNMKVDGISYLPYFAGAADDGRAVITQTIAERTFSFLQNHEKYIADVTARKENLAVLANTIEDATQSDIPNRTEDPFLRLRIASLLSVLPVDLVFQKRQELYNLERDPLELHNQADLGVDTGYYRSRLFEPLDKSRALFLKLKKETAVLDESTRENLRALGYIGQDAKDKQDKQQDKH